MGTVLAEREKKNLNYLAIELEGTTFQIPEQEIRD